MYSLYKVKYHQTAFIITAILIRVLFFNLNWYCYLALIISLHQFFLVFSAIGFIIPIRYLFGAFMCLQMFIGPVLAYNGLDQFQYDLYKMQVPQELYFTYAIPAVTLFIVGLHIGAGKLDGEVIDMKNIKVFINSNKDLPYIFIVIGFFSSLISGYFSSELAFVFYLLGGLKFIGVFLLILGDQKLKIIPLVLIFGSIISSSLSQSMFHDLLIWIVFTGVIVALKFKPSTNIKIICFASFILLVVVIQLLKENYRLATWKRKEAGEWRLSLRLIKHQEKIILHLVCKVWPLTMFE